MSDDGILDVVGVGIGPFNLGLAALAAQVPGLRVRCFERSPGFDWHPGMLIEGTVLQVPFLADLVTAADPTSPYSFLAYLKRTGRLYQFAIREAYFVTRTQYNQYCRWVAEQLPGLEFGTEIVAIEHDPARGLYRVEGRRTATGQAVRVLARHVVVGIGTVPQVPPALVPLPARVLHSARYLEQRAALLGNRHVIVVGSGQSAAEIFHDLVAHKPDALTVSWLTMADRFFPMDYSKLALEMASPDYIDHFHRLPRARRRAVLARQDPLYKGIGAELLARIYDLLYDRSIDGARHDVRLAAGVELEAVRGEGARVQARFRHLDLDTRFELSADHVVLATGYKQRIPAFLAPLRGRIGWDERGALEVNRDYSLGDPANGLYVQNAELETHGFNASDLSLGPYRNSVILNSILGREHFQIERRVAFQDFGVPEGVPPRRGDSDERARARAVTAPLTQLVEGA